MKTKHRNKIVHLKEHHYTVILEPDEGGYHAFCPALPGCHTWGATIEKAMKNVREAVEVYCESLLDDGEPNEQLA